jgi:hypothetical protein
MVGVDIGLSYNRSNGFLSSQRIELFDNHKINPNISFQYASFTPIKNSHLYFNTGLKLNYNGIDKRLFTLQRFGVGIDISKNAEKPILVALGGEVNSMGYGLYLNGNFIQTYLNDNYNIYPEISCLFYSPYAVYYSPFSLPTIMVGLGITSASSKKDLLPEKKEKYAIQNHFNAELSIGDSRLLNSKASEYNGYNSYFHINVGYRILAKQIISPEVGLGFVYHYNSYANPGIYFNLGYDMEEALNYLPYVKVGFSAQTRGKIAFVGNYFAIKTLNIKGGGFSMSAGIKYNISPRIGISISPEFIRYGGIVWGWSKFYGYDPTKGFVLTKGLHLTNKNDMNTSYIYGLYGVKLGIHF